MIRMLKTLVQLIFVLFISFTLAIMVGSNKDKILNKFKKNLSLLDRWMKILENGQSIAAYLQNNHYCNVAVYGLGMIGEHFVKQLEDTDVNISYMIDKNAMSVNIGGISIYRPGDKLPQADVVVVTPVWDFETIKERLSECVRCPIISLSEVIEGNRHV